MGTIGNIIWLVFGGFLAGLAHISAGIGFCLTIIGIPFGLQAFKLGMATLVPFGMEVRDAKDSGGVLQLILNLLWLVIVGWAIVLNHLFWALLLAITIVGLPFAKQHVKLIPLAAFPFGKELR